MNEDTLGGNWKQLKGKVREQWGKLTDDDLDIISGRREQLLGKLQERYGIQKDEAEKQLRAFEELSAGSERRYQHTSARQEAGTHRAV